LLEAEEGRCMSALFEWYRGYCYILVSKITVSLGRVFCFAPGQKEERFMRQQMTAGLDLKLQEMAARIRELREIVGLSQEEMARLTDVDLAEYQRCEDGEGDLYVAFIYRCAA